MQDRCAPGFDRVLRGFSIAEIEQHAGTAFGLWPDFRLAYLNPAWFAFGRANQGEPRLSAEWGLGRSILDSIPPVLQDFYRTLFAEAMGNPNLGPRPPVHCYECSSAKLYRRFALNLYRLGAGEGLLVVNSLLVEQPHDLADRQPGIADRLTYLQADGNVRQCSHCRRIQRASEAYRWDWIPDWVDSAPPETSHTLCNFCLDYYYPADPQEPVSQSA
jgi:hypothetical protein